MSRIALLVILVAGSSAPALAAHQGHETQGQAGAPGAKLPGPKLDDQTARVCVQSQQRALGIARQIARRLEGARPNSPADMRSAIDDLQAALNQVRTALYVCAAPPASPTPGLATSKPAVPVDHAAMGHDVPAVKPAELDKQLVSACVQGELKAAVIIERLNRRLESARQTNDAAGMRGGMDDLQSALGELQASLQTCEPLRAALAAADAAAAAAAMDHSRMAMGGGAPVTGASAKPGAPVAPMDHSKMPMAGGAAAAKPGAAPGAKPATAAKPGAAAGAKPATAAKPMDHSKMPMGGTAAAAAGADAPMKMATPKLPVMPATRVADPACPGNVTQPNAPKAVYQRKVYYFCSTSDRDKFLEDPAAYLKARPR